MHALSGTNRLAKAPEFLRFLTMGVLATLIHWGLMACLVLAGASPWVGTSIGALAGALANYIAQHRYTFGNRAEHRRSVPRYIGFVVLSWCLNSLLFFVLWNLFSLPSLFAQGVTTAVVTLFNYVGYRRYVFERVVH